MVDRSAPGIRLTTVNCKGCITGEIWPLQSRIVNFQLCTEANATDKLTLTAYNDDLALFGHKALQHGTCLDVRWGYAGQLSAPRRVFLEEFRGFTELELIFSGRERSLHQEARVRAWVDTPVGDVVREVAQTNGFHAGFLHADVPNTAPVTINQAGETDAALLQRLACQVGYQFFIDAEGLHWQAPQKSQAPVTTVHFGTMDSTILDITFSSNLMRYVGRVQLRARDPMERRTLDVKAGRFDNAIEVVDAERYASAQQRESNKISVHPSAADTDAALLAEAESRFEGAEVNALEARITVVGDPTLVARRLVQLDGVTPHLAGNYLIQEARHTLGGSGYTTALRLTRGDRLPVNDAQGQSSPSKEEAQTQAADAVEIIDAERFRERSFAP